jgi:hypothetical protein
MKVVPNVEALEKAIAGAYDRQRELVIEWLYDALPDAPLPADVAAAVADVTQYTAVNWQVDECNRVIAAQHTILRALTASVADVQRLREALEAEAPDAPEWVIGPEGAYGYVCGWDAGMAALKSAIAATPATGLVVVDGDELADIRQQLDEAQERVRLSGLEMAEYQRGVDDELAALRAMRERAEEWAPAERPPAYDLADLEAGDALQHGHETAAWYILHGEATDA